MNEWKMRGKEARPEDTVKKVQEIMNRLGFQLSLNELDRSVEDCHSCRLTIEGFSGGAFGTNGKGMTRELSLASAHGEMMERVENRMFSALGRFDDEEYEDFLLNGVPFDDLSGANEAPCITRLIQRVANTVDAPTFWQTHEELVRSALKRLAPTNLNGKFQTLPFYSLKEDRVVYLPNWLNMFLGSNGLAAGNTYEEAMIEGLSELLERYVQLKVLDGNIIPPVIPREYIAKYPHLIKMIDDIEASGRYTTRIMDCSLGMGLPVVCGAIIDRETGRFGVKFGAQPNIAVAIERVFTEAMQGSRLEEFATRSSPDFVLTPGKRRIDKWNSVKISASNMPAQLLMDDESYPFIPWPETAGKSNAKIMQDMIDQFDALHSELYVRDASYLGFPAVFIYAEGVSEVRPVDFTEIKLNLLFYQVQEYFRRIDTLTDKEVKKLAALASARRGAVLENTVSAMSQLFYLDDMPGGSMQADFLYAVCQYRLGNLAEAAVTFRFISDLFGSTSAKTDKARYYRAVYEYVAAQASGIEEHRAYCVISHLFPAQAETVRSQFADRAKVLENIYPVCTGQKLRDITVGGCSYAQVHEFYRILTQAENDNPIDPEAIRAVFLNAKKQAL